MGLKLSPVKQFGPYRAFLFSIHVSMQGQVVDNTAGKTPMGPRGAHGWDAPRSRRSELNAVANLKQATALR